MYENLTLHQRISLKGLFQSQKERRDIGIVGNDEAFKCLRAVQMLWNFKIAINYYLTNDINLLAIKNPYA